MSNETAEQGEVTKKQEKTPVLDAFGRNLTELAKEGKLDPVIGREKEIDRIAQVLLRRTKRNVVLIGSPGVGKSLLVAGLALKIHNKTAPRALLNKTIIELEMGTLVAGTKYRGELESRVKSLITELQKSPDVILFMDEMHMMMGNKSGAEIANQIKPALARGAIQVIGATTLDEYRENIEEDGAMERRFQKVMVEEPTPEETLNILNNIKHIYEEFHNVNYSEAAIKACVAMSVRYITDRALPDKAIDLLDESGAKTRVKGVKVPEGILDVEKEIESLNKEKTRVIKSQEFEKAGKLRQEEVRLIDLLEERKRVWNNQMTKIAVEESDIADVVSVMTNIPVSRISEGEGKRLLEIEAELTKKVIGQPEAISKISKAIRRTRSGIKNPNRVSAALLFLGGTGLGKTFLTQTIADYLFEGRDNLIRIDMNEYGEKFNQSRLIGSPPGYVGYNEGGELTEKVRRKPYSVVLFDEVEKAHPDIFNLLLRTFDEGFMTDSTGRRVDFRNTILIMTSNLGTKIVRDHGAGIGFSNETGVSKEKMESTINKELKKFFAPEFLNRIDGTIIFNPLTKDHVFQIFDNEVVGLKNRMLGLGYTLEITEAMKSFVVDEGFDAENGARPLRRCIEKHIEDMVSEEVLRGDLVDGDTLVVDYVDGKCVSRIKSAALVN